MKIKIEELRSLVQQVVKEAAKEGVFQRYAKSTFNKMIRTVSTGGNKNTPPFIKKTSKAGKSGPPGD
tara:strand:- start:535 stop:735 length:201 start_codon:yes stop_codon:yes gene_type:complete